MTKEGRTGLEHSLFVMKKGRTDLADDLCVRWRIYSVAGLFQPQDRCSD